MRQYTIKITHLAEKDIESIGDYIAYKLLSPLTAEKMVSGIRMKVNSICDFPESHELEDDEMSTVYVVRVLHMRVDSRARLYETFGIAV